MSANGTRLLLASASAARRAMLANAGLALEVEVPGIDEAAVKASLKAENASGPAVAETLAELKAQRVSMQHQGALVIGADQMLECGGVWFDKPGSLATAAEQLRILSGKQHRLIACACVVRNGARLWHHHDEARLTMRPLSDAFIADYLAALGDAALSSVGCYQLEGRGAQLFSRVEGDFFTILGLPLLPLLGFLRAQGVLES